MISLSPNSFSDEAQNANSFAYRDFSNVLNQQMDFFSNDPSADKIQLAKHQIEESRKQLEENIDTILKRDEKIDIIVNQSEQLLDRTTEFNEKSKKLKCAMLLRSVKCWIILIILVAFAIWLTSSIICGFDYSQC